mmetsp:Transcript_26156/g.71736  ORF Transcript_26156/g.71736 Transcript_26156/m.71736 type:complete len:81 (+) Transcript_26156:178-420(+)
MNESNRIEASSIPYIRYMTEEFSKGMIHRDPRFPRITNAGGTRACVFHSISNLNEDCLIPSNWVQVPYVKAKRCYQSINI